MVSYNFCGLQILNSFNIMLHNQSNQGFITFQEDHANSSRVKPRLGKITFLKHFFDQVFFLLDISFFVIISDEIDSPQNANGSNDAKVDLLSAP